MSRLRTALRSASLALLFAGIVFLVLLATLCIAFVVIIALEHAGIITGAEDSRVPLFQFAVASLIIGAIVALVVSRHPVKPLQDLEKATEKIAQGDFSVRVNPKGPSDFKRLGEGFNRMAEELDSVEMLRNDFVNTFSHEFKTPIVSIRGFARMLKRDDLSEEGRREYLDIIIDESERLAGLSDAVLRLNKVEQQQILTETEHFNISEQVRLAITMVDERWSEKNLSYELEGGEEWGWGNKRLLEQVWLNILDNAAKFSSDNSTISVCVAETETGTIISIANEGETVPEEALSHIFDKFYQGDTSRSTQGNGLGLTLAKRIVDLHGGTIAATSEEGITTFIVTIPVKPNEI